MAPSFCGLWEGCQTLKAVPAELMNPECLLGSGAFVLQTITDRAGYCTAKGMRGVPDSLGCQPTM